MLLQCHVYNIRSVDTITASVSGYISIIECQQAVLSIS